MSPCANVVKNASQGPHVHLVSIYRRVLIFLEIAKDLWRAIGSGTDECVERCARFLEDPLTDPEVANLDPPSSMLWSLLNDKDILALLTLEI